MDGGGHSDRNEAVGSVKGDRRERGTEYPHQRKAFELPLIHRDRYLLHAQDHIQDRQRQGRPQEGHSDAVRAAVVGKPGKNRCETKNNCGKRRIDCTFISIHSFNLP